jgi:predicted metal-dependent phosphoesterase TrpH
MSAPTFDLQSHSVVSDGALAPRDVVARAAAAGVELLALTDHDAVDGVPAAIAAGREHGLRVVAGAELSALDGPHEDLHICAYGFDPADPALLDALRAFREDRNARATRMARALEENGWVLDHAALDARRAAGSPIGRPHLAAAAFGHPANADRLRERGMGDASDLLVAELTPGAPSYRRRTMPTVPEAIDVIHAAGGVAVWAHPFWDLDADPDVLETIDRFAAAGLDGVEAFYITHTEAQTRLVAGHCAARGLLSTGSSDFHGPEHPRFHAFRAFETYDLTPRLGPLAA